MFRGILPKRIASSDFTMVTPLGEPPATAPNKENQGVVASAIAPKAETGTSKLLAKSSGPKTSGVVQSRKRERSNTVKDREKEKDAGKEQQPGENMETAFDKLLVRCFCFPRREPCLMLEAM